MKKTMYHSFLSKMYKKATGNYPPVDMTEKEMAKPILEIFGNRKVLSNGNEQQCEIAFRHHVDFGSDKEKMKFILSMEDQLGHAKAVK